MAEVRHVCISSPAYSRTHPERWREQWLMLTGNSGRCLAELWHATGSVRLTHTKLILTSASKLWFQVLDVPWATHLKSPMFTINSNVLVRFCWMSRSWLYFARLSVNFSRKTTLVENGLWPSHSRVPTVLVSRKRMWHKIKDAVLKSRRISIKQELHVWQLYLDGYCSLWTRPTRQNCGEKKMFKNFVLIVSQPSVSCHH